MKQNAALLKVVAEVGSVSELARMLGVSRTHVSNWVAGRRTIPATKVHYLVKLANGKVTPQELRPDVFT